MAVPSVEVQTNLAYAQSPPDNPLKGIMCNDTHSEGARNSFPHSLVFAYLGVGQVMASTNTFDWTAFDTLVSFATNDNYAGHGSSQLVPRFYLDYPGRTNGIPNYLLTNGLTTWQYTNSGGVGTFPDYEDVNFQTAMTNFITAYGARYDGDPRIAFIEMGMVGPWGEWHWGPDSMIPHWASLTAQRVIMDLYTNAFTQTKITFRYPAGTNNDAGGVSTARNDNYPFGYYDDSFGGTTVPTNYPVNTTVPNWFQLSEMHIAGATNHWKYWPNGGELRSGSGLTDLMTSTFSNHPNIWPTSYGADQTWSNAVFYTHSTFMQDWAVFYSLYSGTYYYGEGATNAFIGVLQLGYELWAKSFSYSTNAGNLTCSVVMTNTGVAPFYYNWQIELEGLTNGTVAQTWYPSWTLTSVIPGDGAVTWTHTLTNPPPKPFTMLMRAVNPLAGGKQLRFANANQHATVTNWLTLGVVQ